MVRLFGFRLSSLAMRAGTAIGVAGLAAVALTLPPMEAPQVVAATISPYAYVACQSTNGWVSVIRTSNYKAVKDVEVGVSIPPFRGGIA